MKVNYHKNIQVHNLLELIQSEEKAMISLKTMNLNIVDHQIQEWIILKEVLKYKIRKTLKIYSI